MYASKLSVRSGPQSPDQQIASHYRNECKRDADAGKLAEGYFISLSAEDDDGEETQLDIADESQSPELLLESSLTRDAVRRGLDSLPPDYKQILLLREIQGLSYEEIAAALGIESGTVKSRIFRARKRLCTFLIEDGNIPEFRSSGKMKGGEKQ